MINLDKINTDDYYTIEELAERLGVKIATVRGWIQRGTIRLRKTAIVGKKIYIHGKVFADFWYDRMIAGHATGIPDNQPQTPQTQQLKQDLNQQQHPILPSPSEITDAFSQLDQK